MEGKPQPLVDIAITTTIADRYRTLRLIPLKSTCAPIIAKKRGTNMMPSLSTYSLTLSITLVLATAIPIANAPTIGERPINAAIQQHQKMLLL